MFVTEKMLFVTQHCLATLKLDPVVLACCSTRKSLTLAAVAVGMVLSFPGQNHLNCHDLDPACTSC